MNEKLRILKAQADQNNIVDTTIQSKLNLMIEGNQSIYDNLPTNIYR